MDTLYLGKQKMQDNGTAEPTGPPAERFSIAETEDGRAVAVVDSDILEGIYDGVWSDNKEQQAIDAATEALKKFRGGICVNGVTYKVNRTSRREYTKSNNAQRQFRKDPNGFADKMRAADVLDDVIVATTNWKRDGELRHQREDFVDFCRGNTLISSGDAGYSAEVVVGITANGEYVIYDIVKMMPQDLAIKNTEPLSTATTNNSPGDMQKDSAEQIVSNNTSEVKKKDTRYSVDDGVEDEIPGLSLPTLEDVDGETSGQKENTARGGVRYSAEQLDTSNAPAQYDYTKLFADQIADYQNGVFPEKDTFVLGGTPVVLQKIGLAGLPMTVNQKHIGDVLNGTYKGTPQEILDHTFTAQELSTLPDKIADPIAIIYDKRTGKARASESNVDVLVEMSVASGKKVIAAVQVGGNGHINGLRVDTNKVATVHGNSDCLTRLVEAINENEKGNVAVFYIDKNKTTKVLQSAGNPIPRGLSNLDGFIHSINDPGSPVKSRISNVTESQQFKRWFGDWQNHPENSSKVVNADGTPKVVYHGSAEQFTTFSYGHIGSSTGVGILGDGFYFTDKKRLAKGYGKNVYPVYLQMKNPYIATESDAYKLRTEDIQQQGYDGVILQAPQGDVYMVFENTQIKSATNNIGTFDGSNPDIRYSVDDTAESEKKPSREKTKPVAESKPILAKRDLRNTMLTLFSVPDGRRAELGEIIDGYADRLLKNGSITEEDRKAFFDRMYDAGVMTVPAEEYWSEARNHIVKGRIYVNQQVKEELGGDWQDLRRRAFAAGVYLVNDPSASGIDQWNVTLSEPDMLPGLFDSEDTDLSTILQRIVQVAEEGRDEQMSLAEYTAMLAQQEYVSEAEILDNMERQMDWALRTFAEKAKLEIHLRDRTGVKIAQEREKGSEKLTMQRVKDAQRRAEERQERKEMAQRQRERKELRELQQKTMKQLRWLSKNRYRAPEELQATWDEVLGDIDLYAVGAANEMHWSEKHQATWKDLAQMYKDAQVNDPNFLPSKELQMIVDRLDGDKIADMDIGALQDLYKAAVGIRTEFYNRNNVINDEMHRLFAEVYTDAKTEIESAPGAFKGKFLDKLFNLDQLTPMNVLQRMGGWDPDGVFYSFAKQLEKGERDMRAYSVKAKRMLQEFLSENEAWVRKADGQGKDAVWYELEVPELLELHMGDKPIFGNTVKVWMTPAQKIHMYLESKNVDNLRHMTGGRTFADKELYSNGKRQEAFAQGRTIRLAPETVKQIVSDLTAEEMELARLLEQYYNSFATQEINKVSNILYGYDKAMGKNYAPIYTNRNYTKTEFGVFDVTAEGVGNLKGRQYAVNPSYNIGAFDAFERHVDQTARFCGMAIPARNWTTLMNWRVKSNSMADVITHKWGEEGKKYIEDLITVLQAGDEQKADTISTGLNKLQSDYITAVFGANPSIVLKQLGSIPLASAYLGVGNVPSAKQIASIDRDLIAKYTQDLAWRQMGYSMPETKFLKDNPNWTVRNKFYSFTFGGGAITAMDGWAASTLWPWAENKVHKEHPELELGTQAQIDAGESAFYKKVAEEFENAVARSQSTSDEIHQSRLRKSKNPVTKAFTMFRSDSAQTYNAIRQKIGEAQYAIRSGKNDAAVQAAKKAAGAVFGAMLLNAVWSEAVSFLMALWKNKGKYYRDDEDELTAESVTEEMVANMLGSIAGTVTLGEELFEAIGNIITGDGWYGIDTPGMEQLNDVVETVMESAKGLRELMAGAVEVAKNGGNLGTYFSECKNDILGQIKDVAETAAMYLKGIPVANVEAYLVGAIKWLSPEFEAAYDDLWASVGKNDLKGLTGNALSGRLGRILEERGVRASDATLHALSALYEAGETGAVPAEVPSNVTIGEETYKLNAYQKQVYEKVFSCTVSDALDDVVSSQTFSTMDSKDRARMLGKLYSYGTAQAKAVLFDAYELPESALKIDELKAAGLEIADCIGLVAQGADSDDYLELTENGIDSDKAYDFLIRQEEMEDAAGEEGVKNLDKWRLSVDYFSDVDDQLAALSMVMTDAQMINADVANDFGVTPDVFVTFYEERAQYDANGNGSYTQEEIKATIDGKFKHLSTTQKAVLWQLFNSSAKNNPYSQWIGQQVLDAKAAMKDN